MNTPTQQETKTMEPKYLGDGVYMTFDQTTGQVILTTYTDIVESAVNVIYLEPEVVIRLVKELSEIANQIKP